ncbi:hypothetical protein EMEDMD4_300043 [Sinorhizobium medicae]|uniref:Uncharacterized protein n=1 Tax=Sinorhizobium medicae TaxID=110321 RepID=A0A508WW69_9HYPH|nr:hypothetical protein EMEDMD4_300043 [Sinorhizobium medicae]
MIKMPPIAFTGIERKAGCLGDVLRSHEASDDMEIKRSVHGIQAPRRSPQHKYGRP